MGFPRQEYTSALPCSPPGDLPNPGIRLTSQDRNAWRTAVDAVANIETEQLQQKMKKLWKKRSDLDDSKMSEQVMVSLMKAEDAWVHAWSLSLSDSLWPHVLYPPGSSAHGIFHTRILEWVWRRPPPGDLSDPGIEPVSPALAGGFFITELPEKPK